MSISVHGTNGVTFNDGSLQKTSAQTGFRNRIINGDMRIWQRGTTISNPTTSNFYTADRWGCNRNADISGATVSRDISGLSGFEYSLKLQRTAGNTATGSVYLYYSNESTNTYDLAGSPVTLSFWAKTGANYSGGSLAVQLFTGTGTDQRVYSYTGAAAPINTTQAITSTWTRYTFTGTVSSSATETGLTFFFTPTGTAGADDSVYITGVQLEAGSTATEFERRPIGTELALCQRYYEVGGGSSNSLWSGYAVNTATYYYGVPFIVTKRVTPSIYNITNAGSSGFPATSSSAGGITTVGIQLGRTCNATTNGAYFLDFWNASAEL